MTRSNAIVTGAALICLTLGAAGCSTAFADFNDGAPESKTYPRFGDLPAEPEGVPNDREWNQRVDAMIATREQLDSNAEAAASGPPPDAESAAEEARQKANPGQRRR